jgi:hypothetical protein
MPDASQFNTDCTYPGQWTITFRNPPINMFVPQRIVELGLLMTDLEGKLRSAAVRQTAIGEISNGTVRWMDHMKAFRT